MKKYLITGALALVACATLTSCHSDDELSGSLIEQKLQTYEQVFKQEFGEINPNQDWGFGTANILARTRAAMGRTRAEGDHVGDGNTEHNQWGACDNIYKLDVPPALTEGQKLRVQKYFQAHPYLTYKDPELTDFFVQQVYKGNPTTAGSLSPEQYSTGDGKTVKSSDHMDWLTVGNDNKHVNDFNFGTYDHGNTTTVINTGVKQNDYDIPGNTHQDQITLMQNASTECVGFSVSNGTIHHNDCCALAKAKVIDDWALDEANWVNGKPIGENVWYDGRDENGNVIDNQKWNRSFVGLDYEQKTLEDCYGIGYNNYGQPYSPVYAKVSDGPQKNYVWDGTRFWTWNEIKDEFFYLVDDQGNFILDENGQKQKVVYVNSDTNEICAENADYNQQGDLLRKFTKAEFAAKGITINNADEEVFDLTKVYAKLKQNCMPAINGNLTKYIKNIGGRDYVYSDWIVTLTPALPQGNVQPNTDEIPIERGNESSYIQRTYKELRYRTDFIQNGRIMCEDLGTSSISDIDFNDIVFDAWMYNMVPQTRTKIVKIENGVETIIEDWSDWADDDDYSDRAYTLTDVYLLAGGGTIPVTVQGISFKDALGSDNKILVNTVDDRDNSNIKRYGNPYNNETTWKQPTELRGIENLESFNDIDVVVLYNNSPVPLKSEPGKVPHKICVPIETKWPYERIVINEAYDFNRYVKEGSTISYDKTNAEKIENSKGETIGYYFDERNRKDGDYNVWTMTPTDAQTDSRFHGDVSGEDDITGIPYKDSARVLDSCTDPESLGYEEETVSGGSSSGYQNGDPVLIRRRH